MNRTPACQKLERIESLSRKIIFKVYFIDYAITVVPFFLPFIPFHPIPPYSSASPPLSSCPWVVHVSSLASPFPLLFLTSPCLSCTYHLCFLFPLPFTPSSPSTLHPPPFSVPPLSSCPWVVHISSLASPFPILFLTSPCLFCTYHLCFLFPVPFPPILTSPSPH